jgi:predicted kinase
MDRRAEAGLIRDTHGDLHLEHIYWFPERPVGCEFVIVDCVEFNERFRYADPVADLAFTVMDLGFRGRRDLARIFAREYFEFVEDESGCTLLPFYSAYRAAVRAKVENMQAGESEVPLADRNAARQRATAHWLFALGELSPPPQRPALILFGGLPGSGKSTLAKSLLELPGWDALLIRTDVVRHELHRNAPQLERYGPEMTEQTYTECLKQARETLLAGQRVLVDANFPQESWREQFLALAATLAVPGLFIHCVVADEVARTRLAQRTGDASEADAQIYELVQARWDPLGQATLAHTIILNTNDPVISLRATLAAKLQNDDLA